MDQVIQLRKKTRHTYKERMYKHIILCIFLKQIVFIVVGILNFGVKFTKAKNINFSLCLVCYMSW